MLGGEIARRYGSAGLPDETIHFKFNGSAGPELRRIRSQRRHARTRRRLERLRRQGPLRRPHHRLSAEDLELPAGREHPGRQRRSLRRDQRRGLPQRHRRRALRGPQLGRDRGGRRRGRPRLRIHDQRHRGRDRLHGPQLRRRHERRHRAMCTTMQGDFSTRRCNQASVDLEPLDTDEDVAVVRGLLRAPSRLHRQPARGMDPGALGRRRRRSFIKVFPHEYKRVLGVRARRQRSTCSPTNPSPLVAAAAGAAWVRSPAFLRSNANSRRAARSKSASRTGSKSTSRFPKRSSATRARAAWIAACPSATPAARSTT